MPKFVHVRKSAIGKLPRTLRTYDAIAAREPFAQLLKLFRIKISCQSINGCSECSHGDARCLQTPLFLGRQLLDLHLDHLSQSFGYIELDFLQGDLELPLAILMGNGAPFDHVVECSHHEHRIALRMTVNETSQAAGQICSGGIGCKICGHLVFTKGLSGNFIAQLMNQQILLERIYGMARKNNVNWTVRADQHQSRRGMATCKGGDQIHRGMVHPVKIFENEEQWTSGSDRFQNLADLAKHTFTRSAQELESQHF